MTNARHILTLSCQDQPGIVGAVGMFLADHRCNILESAQFGDTEENRFMMRVSFERLAQAPDDFTLAAAFEGALEGAPRAASHSVATGAAARSFSDLT